MLRFTAYLIAALTCTSAADAATFVFPSLAGTANVYQPDGSTDGTAPTRIAITGGSTITFSATGTISFNGGGNFNDPDGIGSASNINVSATTDFSGFSAPHAGSLVGVFYSPTVALPQPPATLDFNTIGTGFTTLAPLLGQVFFIGDGLTGDGTGTVQSFTAPGGARSLYIGFADAGGYNGTPGSYDDNLGSLAVTVNTSSVTSAVPEAATWAMMIVGFGAVGFALRSAKRRSDENFNDRIRRIANGALA